MIFDTCAMKQIFTNVSKAVFFQFLFTNLISRTLKKWKVNFGSSSYTENSSGEEEEGDEEEEEKEGRWRLNISMIYARMTTPVTIESLLTVYLVFRYKRC